MPQSPLRRALAPCALVVAALLPGCAIRGTVHLVQAEQALAQARAVDAHTWAPSDWAAAHAHMVKARQEWAHADYGDAEALCNQVKTFSAQATTTAQANRSTNTRPDAPPPWVDPAVLEGKPLVAPAPAAEPAAQPAVQPAAPAAGTPWSGGTP
jgi:hypothetical protein